MKMDEIKEIKKENYIFGDMFGNMMRKTTPKFQLESSMMSYAILMISLVILTIKTIYSWSDGAWYWNVFAIVNYLCGLSIIYAMLASSFQAYQSVCEADEISQILRATANEVNDQLMKGGNEINGKG